MNLQEAILYAHQRMREIGKQPQEYHFEPVYVCATEDEDLAGFVQVYAFNEIYILVDPENYSGVLIVADNSGFNTGDPSDDGPPEFTGTIRFYKTEDTWNLTPKSTRLSSPAFIEFLRVVY